MIGVELFVEIKYLDRQGLQQDYVVRYQPCHVQAMTTMASYLQFLTKVLKEPSPGTFKASGPTMSARIAQLKLSPVSKHRLTRDISAT